MPPPLRGAVPAQDNEEWMWPMFSALLRDKERSPPASRDELESIKLTVYKR